MPGVDAYGKCNDCGRTVWDDNLAYGCSHCKWSVYGG